MLFIFHYIFFESSNTISIYKSTESRVFHNVTFWLVKY